MIVQINENNADKYYALFTNAYNFLVEEGCAVQPFNTLDGYYRHIADLFNLGGYQYIFVPLDEETFDIDLNTRTITVPKSFSKCASVQSDLLAETIIFKVNKYFDYMDLENTTIYVHWETPDKITGATRIQMKDIISEPGTIKFAWPLDQSITEKPGDIRFSVSFIRLDNTDQTLVYSLNTLDAKITIKEALYTGEYSNIEFNDPIDNNLFGKAIINSNFSPNIPAPAMPMYAEPGSNIVKVKMNEVNPLFIDELMPLTQLSVNTKSANLEDDTLTLGVQAVVVDTGEVGYHWYYKPNADHAAEPLESSIGYKSVEKVDGKTQAPARHDRYYQYNDNAMTLYTGSYPTETTLYERYSVYTIPQADPDSADNAVVGQYYAMADNTLTSGDSSVVTTNATQSHICILSGPNEIVFIQNLNEHMILGDEENASVTLSVQVEPDAIGARPTYAWEYKIIEDGDWETLTDTTSTVDIEDTGWYKSIVTTLWNREERTAESNVVRVTNMPEAPVVIKLNSTSTNTENTFTCQVQLDSAFEYDNKLKSDGIDYIWQINGLDNNGKWTDIIYNENVAVNSLTGSEGSELSINKQVFEKGIFSIRCLVINNLGTECAVFDHSGTFNDPDRFDHVTQYEDSSDNFTFFLMNE